MAETAEPTFTVQCEIWGRVFGGEQMHLLGTINYRLEDGELISDDDLRVSLGAFKSAMEEEFRVNG